LIRLGRQRTEIQVGPKIGRVVKVGGEDLVFTVGRAWDEAEEKGRMKKTIV